jgi:cyclophilin family peptidyl-prolyl cis-trans isomerase
MGKRAKIRREKRESVEKERKDFIKRLETEKNPFANFWKKLNVWVYVVCLLLVIAFPFIRKDELVMGDQAIIHTSMGDVEVELYKNDAPKTVDNFVKLSQNGYYDELTWHRVIQGFMIQGGDPSGDGTGGESAGGGYLADEINPASLGLSASQIAELEKTGYKYDSKLKSHKMDVGSLAMANSGPDTNGSQFFIVTEKAQPHLDGKHTVFGKVKSGLDIVKRISDVAVDENDKPIEPVLINSIEIK